MRSFFVCQVYGHTVLYITWDLLSHTNRRKQYIIQRDKWETNRSGQRSTVIYCGHFKPYNAGICLYKLWTPKGFSQFEITINVLVSSFRFIWIPYGSTLYILQFFQCGDYWKTYFIWFISHVSTIYLWLLQDLYQGNVHFLILWEPD